MVPDLFEAALEAVDGVVVCVGVRVVSGKWLIRLRDFS